MASFLGHNPLHTSLSNLKNTYYASISIPPRDRVIDFGKYKGKMLGTLPSNYLKWVSNNLRARDFEHWANLADNVLQDPFYKDRLEWEFAEKHLSGDDLLTVNSVCKGSSVAELLELSHRFGWDNEDKVGWSKVDFRLLGTSKGGRIPRVKKRVGGSCENGHGRGNEGGGVEKVIRGVRRERVRGKGIEQPISRETDLNRNRAIDSNQQPRHRETDSNVQVYNPFPGRESLLKKVLTRRNTML